MNKLRLLGTGCAAVCIYASAAVAVTFTPLGNLPGDDGSRANGISGDGSVVVGRSDHLDLDDPNIGEAYRWTRDGGMVGLGYLPDFAENSHATDVSGDGSVVVGFSSWNFNLFAEAFRWTNGGGMVGLGVPAGGISSFARGVSADSSVVVGYSDLASGKGEAFRWTSEDDMVGLGDLEGGNIFSEASDVSADGSVVVGRSESASGDEAFRWTSEHGMVGLGDLAGGAFSSTAYGVSGDGSVVVGYSKSDSGWEAFRWTSEDGMVGLGDLAGGEFYSIAHDVSADGSVVVGMGESSSWGEAFRWTSSGGMKSVASILTAAGVDLTSWRLTSATGVSADGYTIVGYGNNPDGNTEAWIADLSDASPATTPVYLSGTIKTADNMDICAMVLASGQHMFSCNPVGVFSLADLPRESNGTVKRQIYADGFLPEVDTLTDSTDEALVMTRSGACPSYNTPYDSGFFPDSADKKIGISGAVLIQDTQTPVCAMVLANGQFMFSCDGTGKYALNIPLDTNGQFKLQVYADGFAPTIQTFDEFQAMNDVRMARASECQ